MEATAYLPTPSRRYRNNGASRSHFHFLRECRLFGDLSPADLRALTRKARMLEIAKRKQIFNEGEPSRTVYLIRKGSVKLLTTTSDGKEMTLDYLGEGEIFGESALIACSPRDHRAVAAADATLMAFDVETIEDLMRGQPSVGMSLMCFVGQRLKRFQTRLITLMHRSTRKRLACLLLDLARDFGLKHAYEKEIRIDARITHAEMASLVGVTRESISFAMADLENEGLIRMQHRRILLPDPHRLELESA